MQWTPEQECAMQLNGRDILVSAAAGSGKTATLTERIIRSLTAADDAPHRGDISRMLIVTFTRAAAAELRSRISETLSAAIAACEDERLRARLNNQLLGLGSAHISTIDSFYQETVRENFERLGLPAGFRLAEESELLPLKEQLLTRIIDEGYRNAATQAAAGPLTDTPFAALEGNAFALAMDNLLSNRDRGDLPELLLRLYERLLGFPEELELLARNADRLLRESQLPIWQTSEGRALSDLYLSTLLKLRDRLRAAPDILSRAATTNKFLPFFLHDLEAIEGIIDAWQSGDWDTTRDYILTYRPEGKLVGAGNAGQAPDYRSCKMARDTLKSLLIETLPKYFEHDAAECAVRMRRTAQTERALYEVLKRFDEDILEEKKRRAAFDFTDIRRFMLRLLQNEQGEPTDIAHALCERYDAVYIDEYQDVDAVQDRIFALVGAGGKRFMVGDIKQSIYGFRGSDPSLFTRYKERFPAVTSPDDPALCESGNRIYMSKNFRCDPSVIRFTNDVCSYIFEVCPDSLAYDPTVDDLEFSKQLNANATLHPVQLTLISGKSNAAPDEPDAEAMYIATEISRLVRTEHLSKGDPIHPRDIAILMRAEKGAERLVKALQMFGIPTSFAPRVNLAAHPQMTMMVNLLSVIDNPHDDVPLMGLLSSEGSPFTLADVLAVRRGGSSPASLYDDLRAALASDSDDLSGDTLRALTAFFSLLDEWRALAATLPVDRLLRRIYAHPSLAPIASSPALLSIYDHARSFQNVSFCGLYQFLRHFRRVLDNPAGLSAAGLREEQDAVQIMTIHKSKGLEFPVVFLCGCSKQFNRRDESAPIVFDPALGASTKLYCPENASMGSSLTYAMIAQRLHERACEEEMRVLYVALTRARERLYVSAKASKDALKRADLATRGDRHTIISTSSVLPWILGALAPSNRSEPLDPAVVCIEQITAEEIENHVLKDTGAQPQAAPTIQQVENEDSTFYRNVLHTHQSYLDPRSAVRRLPTKAAASKLRAAMLDTVWLPEEFGSESDGAKSRDEAAAIETEAYVRSRIELLQSAHPPFEQLLQAEKKATPAERGTATHLFLQHCSFPRLSRIGVEEEIATLVRQGYLPSRAAAILRRDQLEAFCRSALFPLVSDSAATIYRELHFDRFIPYSHLTRRAQTARALEGYTLYVQGSLDLLIEAADGTLWLCDYKTDRIHEKDDNGIRDQLLAAHADQLRIYAEAVQGLFGRRPDHILIYSLPLGRSIELTNDL